MKKKIKKKAVKKTKLGILILKRKLRALLAAEIDTMLEEAEKLDTKACKLQDQAEVLRTNAEDLEDELPNLGE